ncbi:MAG: tail fiber domain-containing protein [Gammaproteobacteria bacterium TMED104]|nr:MAG: tail fiber domain-containing protein [Gammaproteobacteria bacterium TMED104]|tara:strand:+ start:3624 stop:4778 length:1155 start_codon:yes stop_codon:yes gene_type:complete
MASSYENDLRLEEMGTGEQIGSWGTTTNTNLSLIAEAFSYQTEATFGSDADVTATIADGASDKARAFYLKVTSSGSLSATRTLTIAPNTLSKVIFIENATTGSQSINISQGSGANVTVGNGLTKACILDGGGSGAVVYDMFDKIDLGANAKINGGSFGITASETVALTNKTIDSDSNTITNIVNADIKAAAAIDATKIADGSVTSTEFQYINTLSSNAQTQISAKLNSALPNDAWISSADSRNRLYFTANGSTILKFDSNFLVQNNSGTTMLTTDTSGNFTATGNVSAYSDLALKEDIYQIENALEKVKKLRGVHFTRKSDNTKEIGVVANEVEKVIPELVDEHQDKDLGVVKTMKYANTVGLLIEAVKDLSNQVEELKNVSSD